MQRSKLISFILSILCCLQPTLSHADTQLKSGAHPMKFNHFTYIFLGPALNPNINRTTIKTDQLTFTAIGIDFHHKEKVIEVAKNEIANGAQMIELCGGFGPIWIAKVSEATDGKVPVGSVAYGPEARKPLLDLLS